MLYLFFIRKTLCREKHRAGNLLPRSRHRCPATELRSRGEMDRCFFRRVLISLSFQGKINIYNIEIQRADKGAGYKRARYHSSILDAHALRPKDNFNDLPESYVIFITENDVIGNGEPLYLIERRIVNIDKPFDDGSHIIYVNGAEKDAATELGKLMHDFSCTSADDMYYRELADKVRYFKEDEKGLNTMCKVIEDMRKETAKKAEEQTTVLYIQKVMTKMKLTLEQAMDFLDIPQAERASYANLVQEKL